nr:hypothetical protein GCM10020092_009260 [Actinoplanes digitatis]
MVSWWLGVVEGPADHADLAVHHPGGADDVRSGLGLRDGHLAVELEGGVVVDGPVGGQDPAVSVRGELVEAQVAHDNCRVADLGDQVAQPDVQDAVGVDAAGAGLVLGGVVGHAEQHQAADARADRLVRGLAQRLAGVLHDARQ